MDSWVALIVLLAPLVVLLGLVLRGGRLRARREPSPRDDTRRAGSSRAHDGPAEAGRRAVSRAVGKSGGVYGGGG